MNGGNYRDLIINDDGYDPISQDIPWTKITEFLFRPIESSESRNSIDITTDRPSNRENTIEFLYSVKERFLSSVKVVNFDFALSYSDARLEIEKVHNNRTNQNLIYGSYESSVHLHTLAVGDTPDESISSYDDDSSDSSSNYDDDF
ncbi:hypothetical protein Ddc_22224 [Ditylenchus destructor]|nr:hypothetical protein Ddc_22224 [Ditylenchus destructor]